ncbi:FAD-dependent oxidoreductase [Pokkaliibacter sp. MBI-7]|uniref:NAD(P)/FAD-dependent oxidoreductase n=1 Tax=Pokkaliibacter sp. MBI-7 TaxID=3040600 RepID=UPI00244C5607|nr:FAD-dependent oxidoreductase [Pokkaliibacter sp. MBI-7]MDH2433196.1 FAD-dependent oxidoreductase [Pokkaliibacter sp. MBI-7]
MTKAALTHSSSAHSDVLIIGGGVLGCALGYYLSRDPALQITLLERQTLGSGTTSFAAGLLTKARPTPQVRALVSETFAAIARLNEEGIDIPFNQVGSLHIGCSDSARAQVSRTAELAQLQQDPVQWLQAEQVSQRCPWLQVPGDCAAALLPHDGFIDPYQLCMAYAQGARRQGVNLRQYSAVQRLLRDGQRITGVELEQGEQLLARWVIDAAGPWSTALAYEQDLFLAMAPVRSHYWITASSPLFPSQSPMVILPDALAYARPEVGGLLFGLRDQHPVYASPAQLPVDIRGFSFGEDDEGWEALAAGFSALQAFFPALQQLPMAHHVSNISSYTPDGLPLLGQVGDVEGFIAATGCSGAGVSLSGGIARLISADISGHSRWLDRQAFSPNRFGRVDPMCDEFQRRCALARANKRTG